MPVSVDELVAALRLAAKENAELRRQNTEFLTAKSKPVAVVGMACRFPGGVVRRRICGIGGCGWDAVSGFPADRGWDVEGLFDPDPDAAGTCYVREGGFLWMRRGLMRGFSGFRRVRRWRWIRSSGCCWRCRGRRWSGRVSIPVLRGSPTGVFVGMIAQRLMGLALSTRHCTGYWLTGSAASVVSGRVAYMLGLEGPAVTVDTACSSSLVALHLAVQALRSGECELALAGGVTVSHALRFRGVHPAAWVGAGWAV